MDLGLFFFQTNPYDPAGGCLLKLEFDIMKTQPKRDIALLLMVVMIMRLFGCLTPQLKAANRN